MTTVRALGLRIGDVLLHLRQRLGVDQRSLVGLTLEAIADAQLAHRRGELLARTRRRPSTAR